METIYDLNPKIANLKGINNLNVPRRILLSDSSKLRFMYRTGALITYKSTEFKLNSRHWFTWLYWAYSLITLCVKALFWLVLTPPLAIAFGLWSVKDEVVKELKGLYKSTISLW